MLASLEDVIPIARGLLLRSSALATGNTGKSPLLHASRASPVTGDRPDPSRRCFLHPSDPTGALHVREAARFFSDAERAALNWAEAVNAIPLRTPSDADFDAVKRHLSDAQIADLTFQVGAIRSWNMLNASFHTQVPEAPYLVG